MSSTFYPESLLPVIREEPQPPYQRFTELRELILLDYGYNTARAYWGDLDDVYRWSIERGKDVLALRESDVRQYVSLLRRRKYSENTIRRRVTALRKLYALITADNTKNPTYNVVVPRPRKK
ncbi:site-specific integrase [Mycobacterium sp.]|uniref:site-specific integrase n=1 Tax=Mycobacterium sp. TaxID=1785 RepID=UPI0039C97B8B